MGFFLYILLPLIIFNHLTTSLVHFLPRVFFFNLPKILKNNIPLLSQIPFPFPPWGGGWFQKNSQKITPAFHF